MKNSTNYRQCDTCGEAIRHEATQCAGCLANGWEIYGEIVESRSLALGGPTTAAEIGAWRECKDGTWVQVRDAAIRHSGPERHYATPPRWQAPPAG
jgi:hypothetical protein